ncbi:DUF3685 domain-containing protein [Pseudanabaena sp. FACHB-1998]|uniref:DUF3685 domain-containing protein n=1 Tax=Pseudanabaena sp. FACHB-1998 TaxID=2692858 RepID=UPI0016804713|nr:DUF3685 domain-containing protein [Pseudanabaena sp. FACHB-1998]MBD2179126.1 DUF3685 domain-containing protein [Pseudanabaena sp. FACHB-1998]
MSNDIYRLMLIDGDRIFRLGMRSWLEQFADISIVAEANAAEIALEILSQEIPKTSEGKLELDLVLLDLNLNESLEPIGEINKSQGAGGLALGQKLKATYPHLPILLLTSSLRSDLVAIALRSGIEGVCLKATPPEELIRAIRQVATGHQYYRDRDSLGIELSERQVTNLPNEPVSVLAIIRNNFYLSGLKRIDRELTQIQAQITANLGVENPLSDRLSQMVLAGQARELQAARWLINQLWGTKKISNNVEREISQPSVEVVDDLNKERNPNNLNNILAVQASLWDLTVTKLQANLSNISKTSLEIDILKEDKKRELLYIALRQVENSLTELRFAQIQPSQLGEQIPTILKNIWQETVINFFGKYYRVSDPIDSEINIVDVLLKDIDIVQVEILDKIPQLDNLISHLLFNTELIINNSSAAIGTPEAMQRAELILDNLIIQIANAVIQPLLNHFADLEEIKQKFYRYNLLATREIERFRNDLSWKYRLEKYITDPQLIFESRHILFVFANPCIRKVSIYAPRSLELEQLEGVQLAVTLVLELQDAIAPRLKSALRFLGSGFVYVLTNVIGQGIGLIGRGVLQGIGNAWQDNRSKK